MKKSVFCFPLLCAAASAGACVREPAAAEAVDSGPERATLGAEVNLSRAFVPGKYVCVTKRRDSSEARSPNIREPPLRKYFSVDIESEHTIEPPNRAGQTSIAASIRRVREEYDLAVVYDTAKPSRGDSTEWPYWPAMTRTHFSALRLPDGEVVEQRPKEYTTLERTLARYLRYWGSDAMISVFVRDLQSIASDFVRPAPALPGLKRVGETWHATDTMIVGDTATSVAWTVALREVRPSKDGPVAVLDGIGTFRINEVRLGTRAQPVLLSVPNDVSFTVESHASVLISNDQVYEEERSFSGSWNVAVGYEGEPQSLMKVKVATTTRTTCGLGPTDIR